MSNLTWFQNWFTKQTVNNYGNKFKVNISTIKNSGWKVVIDLTNTKYHNITLDRKNVYRSPHNRYSIEIKDCKFIAEGDFSKLDFFIGKFREIVSKTSKTIFTGDDYFFIPDIQDFIFEKEKEAKIFMHYTKDKFAVKSIIKTGFRFVSTFDKTTTETISNPVVLNYHHFLRKPFGNYVIIICISEKIYNYYLNKINELLLNDTRVEEILTEKPYTIDDNLDKVYTLHHKYVKGYFNFYTKEIVKNNSFDADYNSEMFLQNLEQAVKTNG